MGIRLQSGMVFELLRNLHHTDKQRFLAEYAEVFGINYAGNEIIWDLADKANIPAMLRKLADIAEQMNY